MVTKIAVFHPPDLIKHSFNSVRNHEAARLSLFYGPADELCCDQSVNFHFALLQWECRGLREQQVTCYRVIQGLALCGRFTVKMLCCFAAIYSEENVILSTKRRVLQNMHLADNRCYSLLYIHSTLTVYCKSTERSRFSVLHSCGDHEISMGPSRFSSFFCLFIPAWHHCVKITHIWHRPPSLVILTLVCHTERSLLRSFMLIPVTQYELCAQCNM